MFEKIVEIGMLFDFYGNLLSDKQYQVVDMHYNQDLSLSEIGDELEVSRQGVFDLLKRSEQKLYEYENKLALVKRFYIIHENVKNIMEVSQEIIDYKNIDGEIVEKARTISEIGKKILDNNSREVVE